MKYWENKLKETGIKIITQTSVTEINQKIHARGANGEPIENIWELYSMFINCYIVSNSNFALCGFEEDDPYTKPNIIDVTEHWRRWFSDSKDVISFRYYAQTAIGLDLVFVKISKPVQEKIQLMILSQNKDDYLATKDLKLPESLGYFKNIPHVMCNLDRYMRSTLSRYAHLDSFKYPCTGNIPIRIGRARRALDNRFDLIRNEENELPSDIESSNIDCDISSGFLDRLIPTNLDELFENNDIRDRIHAANGLEIANALGNFYHQIIHIHCLL